MPKVLEIDSWLSAKEAKELIFYFIRWGEHSQNHLRRLPDELILTNLRELGYDFNQQVADLQKNPHKTIAKFENLINGGTWEFEASPNLKVTQRFMIDGVEISKKEINEHAVFREAHTSDFLAACNARDDAIRLRSFDSFYTAISKGFSSIEAYFTLRTYVYNAKCEDLSKKLNEKRTKGGFFSLDEKLKDWLPIMTGSSIDITSSPGWDDYKFLRNLRNDVVIHPKPGSGLTTIEELADGLNRFRYGIGSLMFLLHQAFGEPIQSVIIRSMRYPTVRVIQSSQTP